MKSSMPAISPLRTFRPKNALLPGSPPTANSSSKPPENKRVRSFDIASRAYRCREATAEPTAPVASGVAIPAAPPAVHSSAAIAGDDVGGEVLRVHLEFAAAVLDRVGRIVDGVRVA